MNNPNVVNDNCGVFVAPAGSDMDGDGTRKSPFATLAKAISVVKGGERRIFACSGDYAGTVSVPSGTQIYGSRDCAGAWERTETRSALRGAPGEVPLRMLGGASSKPTFIDGFRFEAAAAMTPGGSSIAAIADNGATAELADCELIAGPGKGGAPGKDAPVMPQPTAQLTPMNSGASTDCASMTGVENAGGAQHTNSCPSGDVSVGGEGGNGQVLTGADGQPGAPQLAGGGAGGTKNGSCVPGGAGNGGPGLDGSAGMTGLAGAGEGMLSPTKGWIGVAGGDGGAGTPGQGGGGGAGQAGKFMCAGASGGSGGAGGCGGQGGQGGGAGGSSIALVSIHATITLNGGKLDAASGGAGGRGGNAQTGGTGSDGAPGGMGDMVYSLSGGCKGGAGGAGGPGGQGGGGAGGHSLAVAYAGSAPTGTFDLSFGPPGAGGKGGFDDSALNHGSDGKGQASLPIETIAPN